MKKKAIKIATASAIAASGFVAVAPTQSEAAPNVKAEVSRAKTVMYNAMYAYSKPFVATGEMVDQAVVYAAYKKGEAQYKYAVSVVNKYAPAKEKAALLADLDKVRKNYLLGRALNYIKAFNALELHVEKAAKELEAALATNDEAKIKEAKANLEKVYEAQKADLNKVVESSIKAHVNELAATVVETAKAAAEKKLEEIAVPKVESVSAITSKSLKVTFSKAVDDTKAVFAVTKDGIKGNISKVTFAEDKKSATLELSTKLTKGEYTVQVTGLTAAPLTSSVSAEDEKVASIQILSESAPLLDADSDNSKDDVTVGYKVLNQYGEDITKTTVLTSNLGTAADVTNGKVTITGDYKVGDKIPLTLINVENAVSATAVLTVSSEARVADIAITGLYNKDGKALNEDTDLSSDAFYLLVDAKDQYGNAVTSTAQLNNDIIINETNNTVTDVAATFTTVEVNGVTKTALKVNAPGSGIKAGTNTVTLISNTTGKNASFTVNVAESTRADVVTLSQPSLVVAGEDAYIPVSVTDKNGTAVTDVKTLNNAVKGVKVTVGSAVLTNPFVVKDGVLSIKVPKTELTTDGYVSLVTLSSTNKVATLTLNVKKAAVPTVIRGLSSDFGTTIKATNSTDLDVNSFVIEDQYGRVMSSDAVKAWIAAGGKIIVSEDENSSTVDISNNPGANDIAGVAEKVTVTAGNANGTEKLSAVLNDGTKNLTNSTKEFTLRVTDGSEYKSYTVDTIGTVYDEDAAGKSDNDAYDKTIKVYGVLADGSKVLLTNGADYNVTSTNTAIDTDVADGVIDLDTALTAYDTNATTAVIPVKVTINATGQDFSQDVTFSKAAPKVASVALVDDNTTTASALTSIKVAAGDNFDITTLTAGAGKNNLLVTDQYGVKKVATANTGIIAFDDTTTVSAPTLTIVPVSGSVTITGNGTPSASVTGSTIQAGDAFDVKVTYAGGATTTIRVTAE